MEMSSEGNSVVFACKHVMLGACRRMPTGVETRSMCMKIHGERKSKVSIVGRRFERANILTTGPAVLNPILAVLFVILMYGLLELVLQHSSHLLFVSAYNEAHIINFAEHPDVNTTNALSKLRFFIRNRPPKNLRCDPAESEIVNQLERFGSSAQRVLRDRSIYGVFLVELARFFDDDFFSNELSVVQNFLLHQIQALEKHCRPMAFLMHIVKAIGIAQYDYVQSRRELVIMDEGTWQRVQQVFQQIAVSFLETGEESIFYRELAETKAWKSGTAEEKSGQQEEYVVDMTRIPKQLFFSLHPAAIPGLRRMLMSLQESPHFEAREMLAPTILKAYSRFVTMRKHLVRLWTVNHAKWVYHVLPIDNMELVQKQLDKPGEECLDRTETMFTYEKGKKWNFYRLFREGVAELLGKPVTQMDPTVARAMRLKNEEGAGGETGSGEGEGEKSLSDAVGKGAQVEEVAPEEESEKTELVNVNRMVHYLLMTDPSFTFPACTPAVLLALLVYINKLFEESIQAMLRNEPLAGWSHFLQYAHHLINRVYLPARNKFALPNWQRWVAGGVNIDWVGLMRLAENRMMSKKDILYGQKINRADERRDICQEEGHCLTTIVPEEYDVQMKEIFNSVVDELERLNLEFWPAGGTMIGAMRWGKIAGQLTGENRWDVIDDDLEFMIGLGSEDEWLDVSAELSQAFTQRHGAKMCHQTYSLHQKNQFWSNYVRQDLLACGWYKPYAIGVELRSYVKEERLNFGYIFRMGGTGYSPWCSADQYTAKKEFFIEKLRVKRVAEEEKARKLLVVEQEQDDRETTTTPSSTSEHQITLSIKDAIEARHGTKIFNVNPWTLRRGTGPVPRYLEDYQKRRRRKKKMSGRGGQESTNKNTERTLPPPRGDGKTISRRSSASALPVGINPLCYLGDMPVFQSWGGFVPLRDYLLPLSRCTLFDRGIPCPRESLDLLSRFNGGEYENPDFCLAIPYLAGRNLHKDSRMKNLEHDVLNAADLNLLKETSQSLSQNGFQSFTKLWEKDNFCDEVSYSQILKRASDYGQMCPPTREKHGLEDYEDEFSFTKK
ncbi:unnamed protein product [Amoebophrya sp. A25]|nr:unnamed protein product [Amoebophrya sp. A25]|eukprot:GSA25T00006797001.1